MLAEGVLSFEAFSRTTQRVLAARLRAMERFGWDVHWSNVSLKHLFLAEGTLTALDRAAVWPRVLFKMLAILNVSMGFFDRNSSTYLYWQRFSKVFEQPSISHTMSALLWSAGLSLRASSDCCWSALDVDADEKISGVCCDWSGRGEVSKFCQNSRPAIDDSWLYDGKCSFTASFTKAANSLSLMSCGAETGRVSADREERREAAI